MGIIKNLIQGITKKTRYADMLNGYSPVFSQFGTNIYASDVVQQAVECVVTEMSKLQPTHVRMENGQPLAISGTIQKILEQPNELMAKTDFLEKITWSLMLEYNSFIVPVYEVWKQGEIEKRNYKALYPVQPRQVDFLEDDTGTLFIQFRFANGYETMFPYSDVIHIRKNFSVNEYMGGNQSGQPDYQSLIKTLQLNDDLLKGVSAAAKSSMAINGVAKIHGIIGKEEQEAAVKEFEQKIKRSESGILLLDGKNDYEKVSKDVKLVDADTLKFIDEKILRQFGVPLPILTGDYTKEQYAAFYQKTIEPMVEKFSEAFTRVLFTNREKGFGNKIIFFPKDLIFMSVEQTLEMVRLLGDSGTLWENEKRFYFGLQPRPELNGIRMQSLNYVNVNIADNYQLKANGKGEEE